MRLADVFVAGAFAGETLEAGAEAEELVRAITLV
jgi:hypothetical protein